MRDACPDRFGTIDALRGVAAIAVMLYHAGPASPVPMPGGYLAVDLFFALSGFVIAHSYAGRLEAGMGAREFMWRRVARLWPMLGLGALLGMMLHGGHAGMLFLLPNPYSPTMLFPANPPLWSLLFEMIAYGVFAIVWRNGGLNAIAAITAASAIALLGLAGSDHTLEGFGAQWPGLLGGFARLGFAFGMGVCLWHLHHRRPRRRVGSMGWSVPAAFLVLAATLPSTNLAGVGFIMLAVPVLVFAAINLEIGGNWQARALGDLSYPLYCIHVPLIATASGHPAAAALLLTLPIIALWLDRAVDAPAIGALKRILLHERTTLSAV